MLDQRAQLGLRLLRKDDAVEAGERPIVGAGIRLQPPCEARQPRRRHAPEAGEPILGLGPRRATALGRRGQRHRDRVGHRLERDLEAVGDRFDEVGIVRAAFAHRRADGLAAILDARRRQRCHHDAVGPGQRQQPRRVDRDEVGPALEMSEHRRQRAPDGVGRGAFRHEVDDEPAPGDAARDQERAQRRFEAVGADFGRWRTDPELGAGQRAGFGFDPARHGAGQQHRRGPAVALSDERPPHRPSDVAQPRRREQGDGVLGRRANETGCRRTRSAARDPQSGASRDRPARTSQRLIGDATARPSPCTRPSARSRSSAATSARIVTGVASSVAAAMIAQARPIEA